MFFIIAWVSGLQVGYDTGLYKSYYFGKLLTTDHEFQSGLNGNHLISTEAVLFSDL